MANGSLKLQRAAALIVLCLGGASAMATERGRPGLSVATYNQYLGGDLAPIAAASTPAEFKTFLDKEEKRWTKLIKEQNIKPE